MMIILPLHFCIEQSRLVSRFIYVDGEVIRGIPCPLRGCTSAKNPLTERDREKMKQLLKTTVASAAAVFALGFVAMSTPAAAASNTDYCRTDITSGMRGCGYTSLEQCHSMSSGRGGDCYPNPFPSGSASNASNTTGNGNSYAYQPKHSVSKRTRKPVEDR
jgi:hypothetical protein